MTKILLVILGWLLIINGILFLIWPEAARKRIARQGYKIFRWQLLGVAVFFIIGALSVWSKTDVGVIKMSSLAIAGLTVWLFFAVKNKFYEYLIGLLSKVPAVWLRGFAAAQLIVGIVILKLKGHF